MTFETCPLLNDITWLQHGFYGNDNPCAATQGLKGFHRFDDPYPQTLFLRQDHTDGLFNADDVPADPKDMPLADASFTDQNNIALAIKTADCCPVLLVCTATQQIANIHAGWPGALNRITLKCANELIRRGAQPDHIIAAIGPCIHAETYPVRDDVRDKFAAYQPETLPYFLRFEDHWKLDIAGIVTKQLHSIGITQIWHSAINTYTDLRYASYRRNQNQAARNIALIMKITP